MFYLCIFRIFEKLYFCGFNLEFYYLIRYAGLLDNLLIFASLKQYNYLDTLHKLIIVDFSIAITQKNKNRLRISRQSFCKFFHDFYFY
jgi:hypothetical protein